MSLSVFLNHIETYKIMSSSPPITWSDYGRIMIFVDAANVIYSLRDLGWKIDYKRFQKYFQNHSNLIDIYFYTAFFEEREKEKNMLEMLSRKGFKVRSKVVKRIKTADGIVHKANCDVELAMDVTALYRSFDTAILLSGDSDFVPLVELLHRKGKKVITISTRGHIAKELIEHSDQFFHFGQFKGEWRIKEIKKIPPAGSRGSF